MLDLVRTSLHRALTTSAGDRFFPVRVPKDLARRFNAALGEPICSKEELERRRAGRAKLEELKQSGRGSARVDTAAPAPVMIYFEEDRNARTLGRIKKLFDEQAIAYTLLDVTDDPTTKEFVLREAKCKDGGLPIVFVATTPIGGYDALAEWNASGRLAKALAGQ